MSMPEEDNDRETPVMLPASDSVKLAARDEYLGKDGLCGVTQWVKERTTLTAV